MESFEAKSQLDNQQQQLPDPPLHSNPSADDDDDDDKKLLHILAQDLQNLVFSCKDEAPDLCIQIHSVAIDESSQAESSSGSEDKNKVPEVNQDECRVSEERETGERCENLEGEVDEDVDLEGKHEDEDVSSEIGDCESNGGNGREDEQVEDLENESENVGGDIGWEEGPVSVLDDGKSEAFHYPLRLDAEDCSFYIRTGVCKFGSSCKFNHPLRRKNQAAQPSKETKKRKEENLERHGPNECKYHTSSAGRKYGKACKNNHGRGKAVKTPVVEYNFVGLPIRPGEKECPYYMRNGSCKYGPSCRFNHPDPTVVEGDDTTYGNDGPLPLQPNIPNMPSRSAPRTPYLSAGFVSMMYPPTQSMPPPNPDWNSYQAPAPVPAHVYPSSERSLPIPPAFFPKNPPSDKKMYTHHQQPNPPSDMKMYTHHQQPNPPSDIKMYTHNQQPNPPNDTKMYTHHQQPILVPEYPERPGQPECGYFMKTGVCKYRASCKFHHPQSRVTKTSRDQKICTYFSRHGICKYGQACKYDHPVNYNSNSIPAGERYEGSNGPRHMIQQSL